MSRFNLGDVVHLRSGGPGMTVLEVHDAEDDVPQRYGVCSLAADGANLFTCVLPEFVFDDESARPAPQRDAS